MCCFLTLFSQPRQYSAKKQAVLCLNPCDEQRKSLSRTRPAESDLFLSPNTGQKTNRTLLNPGNNQLVYLSGCAFFNGWRYQGVIVKLCIIVIKLDFLTYQAVDLCCVLPGVLLMIESILWLNAVKSFQADLLSSVFVNLHSLSIRFRLGL